MLLLHSCNKPDTTDHSLTPEEYRALGLPDYTRVWSIEDYSNAFLVLNTLKYNQPKALPSRDSEKSAVLFSRMINIDNLSFLQDETLALHDKAEMIQVVRKYPDRVNCCLIPSLGWRNNIISGS